MFSCGSYGPSFARLLVTRLSGISPAQLPGPVAQGWREGGAPIGGAADVTYELMCPAVGLLCSF